MGNGAYVGKGNAARATALSPPPGALTGLSTAYNDSALSELLLDDPMDDDGVLEAAQISQVEIIERQAETIARLERHAARDKEYRTVTKVKLKEAAARLKEYRLRVEALMTEVETARTTIARLENDKKKALAQAKKKAPAVEPKRVVTKSVMTQTPWKTARSTVSSQTEMKPLGMTMMARVRNREASTTNSEKATSPAQAASTKPTSSTSNASETTSAPQTLRTKAQKSASPAPKSTDLLEASSRPTTSASPASTSTNTPHVMSTKPTVSASPASTSTSTETPSSARDTKATNSAHKMLSTPTDTVSGALPVTALPNFDAIGAAIDADLDFSDDDHDQTENTQDSVSVPALTLPAMTQEPPASTPVLDDPISRAVDELDLGGSSSDCSDDSSDDSSDDDDSDAVDADGETKAKEAHLSDSAAAASKSVNELDTEKLLRERSRALSLSSDDDETKEQEVKSSNVPVTASENVNEKETERLLRERSRALSLSSDDEVTGAKETNPSDLADPARESVDDQTEQLLRERSRALSLSSDDGEATAKEVQTSEAAVNGSESVSEKDTAELLRERSRALSLSSNTSSSSSSSSETNSVLEKGPAVKTPLCPPGNDVASPVSPSADRATSSVGVVDDSNKKHIEGKKRPNDQITPTGVKTELKKRKLEVCEEAASVPSRYIAPDTRNGQLGTGIPHHTSATGTLAPKDLVAFKVAITLQQGEKPDITFVTRTLGVLVKHTATHLRACGSTNDPGFTITDNDGVTKLCNSLVNEHFDRQISHELLLEGMIRIFRTPRTRHAIEKSTLLLTALFQSVFFLRIGLGDISGRGGEARSAEDMVPEVHQCLLALRDLVVTPRLQGGLVPSRPEDENGVVVSSAALSTKTAHNVSHDAAFIAHIGAFYVTICRALDRFDLPLALLLDIVTCHPNIKGLYCVRTMIEVDPRILRKRWDVHGQERRSALRSAFLHVLQVITHQSVDKQAVVYRESPLPMLTSISRLIDDPLLASISPPGNARGIEHLVCSIAATMWSEHIAPSTKEHKSNVFDVAKALELLAAYHGDRIMVQYFPVSQFVDVGSRDSTLQDGQVDIAIDDNLRVGEVARLICAVGRGTLRQITNHRDRQDREQQHHSYVDEVVRWMLKACPREDVSNDQLLSGMVSDLTDLLLGVSTVETMCKQRDEWLRQLLQILRTKHLHLLPAQPLRQLRLLVMAAQPLTISASV